MILLEGGETNEGNGDDEDDEGVPALGKEAGLVLKLLATAGVLDKSYTENDLWSHCLFWSVARLGWLSIIG